MVSFLCLGLTQNTRRKWSCCSMLCPNVPCQSLLFQLWPFTFSWQCWFHHWCAGNTSLLDRVLSRYFLNPILVYINSWGKRTMPNLFTRGARCISPWRSALDLGSTSLECWEEFWGHMWVQTGKNLESYRMVLPAGCPGWRSGLAPNIPESFSSGLHLSMLRKPCCLLFC